MKKAVILHGTLGSPEGNWIPWLEAQLYDMGYEVWAPALPGADQPSLRHWLSFIHENRPFSIDNDTLVVGHSSGAILALLIAQETMSGVGATVAVSVFHDNSLDWDANSRLFDVDFNWPSIRAHAGKMLFVHSDNDPYVPLDQAKYVSANCDSDTVVVPGAGHFNTETGPEYTEFPKLLELMRARQIV